MKPELLFLRLSNMPILEQLRIEEALLRGDTRNWCLVNTGAPAAIVMGISGKPELLIDSKQLESAPLPVIKRFSGGGTVVIDEETLFVTFIFQKSQHPFPAYPEPILRWTETLYKRIFPTPHFALKENDYVIGARKCGGNAQYIRKERWLHHTSFLWHFEEQKMRYLRHPPKAPLYRAGRAHSDFLCRLREHFEEKEAFFAGLRRELEREFALLEVGLDATDGISIEQSRISLITAPSILS